MQLPYWGTELEIMVAPWFPLGVDYRPVSVNSFYNTYDTLLTDIARACMALDSELFFVASTLLGCAGSLVRDNFCKIGPGQHLNFALGFTMILGYSRKLERAVKALLDEREEQDILGGIAFCSIWRQDVLAGAVKTIVLTSSEPVYNELKFLYEFYTRLFDLPDEEQAGENAKGVRGGDRNSPSFYAEKLGYTRFVIPHETDNPLSLRISHLLYEMEYADTREVVGDSPEVPLPGFVGLSIDTIRSDF